MTSPYPDNNAAATSAEAQEVVQRYARRTPVGKDRRYSIFNPEVWQGFQERQRALIHLLSRHAKAPLNELKVLEVGCGGASNLLELLQLGFDPQNLVGNDLLPERAALARHKLPASCGFFEGDALALAFEDRSFDIVYQSTVFTSLLDDEFQQRLAARLWQWVKPGGAVLWYDFIYNNPSNPDVRGVPVKRIRELFPQAQITVKRVTLAPPLSRRVCRIHSAAYPLFNAVPWLRSHVLCWIEKKL